MQVEQMIGLLRVAGWLNRQPVTHNKTTTLQLNRLLKNQEGTYPISPDHLST